MKLLFPDNYANPQEKKTFNAQWWQLNGIVIAQKTDLTHPNLIFIL